nr:MAG TPA: hypothetical protein [Caudoviricetes sp.]
MRTRAEEIPKEVMGGRPEMDIADVTSEGTEDMKDAD